MKIDITGIDKAELLAALHNGTPALGMGRMQDQGPITPQKAQEVIDHRSCIRPLYFDYLFGHPIKTDIGGNEMETNLYDRDAGSGKAEAVVAGLNRPVPASPHPFK